MATVNYCADVLLRVGAIERSIMPVDVAIKAAQGLKIEVHVDDILWLDLDSVATLSVKETVVGNPAETELTLVIPTRDEVSDDCVFIVQSMSGDYSLLGWHPWHHGKRELRRNVDEPDRNGPPLSLTVTTRTVAVDVSVVRL